MSSFISETAHLKYWGNIAYSKKIKFDLAMVGKGGGRGGGQKQTNQGLCYAQSILKIYTLTTSIQGLLKIASVCQKLPSGAKSGKLQYSINPSCKLTQVLPAHKNKNKRKTHFQAIIRPYWTWTGKERFHEWN